MDTTKLPEDFWNNFAIDPDYGCFHWTGCVDRLGYGKYKLRYTHRVAYEALVGPIPRGMVLDHVRMNPGPYLPCSKGCGNPAHLEVVTQKENIRRGHVDSRRLGRSQLAKTHCPAGHEYTEANTYSRPSAPNSRECKICRKAHMDRTNARIKAEKQAMRLRQSRRAEAA